MPTGDRRVGARTRNRGPGGEVRAGITAAVREVVERYELFSLNFVLAERHNIWAFRYPEANPLMLLRRRAGGSRSTPGSEARRTRRTRPR